jgi:hypothetical protein
LLNLRAYRIGQQRDVFVYRLISSGCIEENIYLRQVDKQLLTKECVENEDSRRYFSGSKKSKNESEIYGMENLLHLATDNTCLTKEIFKVYFLSFLNYFSPFFSFLLTEKFKCRERNCRFECFKLYAFK